MRGRLWADANWDYIAQKEHCWKDLVTWWATSARKRRECCKLVARQELSEVEIPSPHILG